MKNASISLNITFQKKFSRPGSSATRRYFLRIDLFLFCEKIDWDTCRSKYYEFLTFWYTTWSKASVVVRSTWRQSWYPCKINLCERSTVQFNNVNQEIGISRRIQSKKMFWNKQSLTSQKYRFIVRKFCQALCLFPVYVYASEETLCSLMRNFTKYENYNLRKASWLYYYPFNASPSFAINAGLAW